MLSHHQVHPGANCLNNILHTLTKSKLVFRNAATFRNISLFKGVDSANNWFQRSQSCLHNRTNGATKKSKQSKQSKQHKQSKQSKQSKQRSLFRLFRLFRLFMLLCCVMFCYVVLSSVIFCYVMLCFGRTVYTVLQIA